MLLVKSFTESINSNNQIEASEAVIVQFQAWVNTPLHVSLGRYVSFMNETFENCNSPAAKSIQHPFTNEGGPGSEDTQVWTASPASVGLFTLHRLDVPLKLGSNSIISTFLFMI
jgi:hypothetical protein